jgi:HK97 gp10 family phage protein
MNKPFETNIDELIVAFAQLADIDSHAYVLAGTKESAEIIRDKAKQLVPVESGDLRDAIEIKPVRAKLGKYSKSSYSSTIYTVGFKYVTYSNKGGVNYGHLVELGHKLRRTEGGPVVGKVQQKPFLRPAADTSKEQVYNILVDAMNKGLEEFGKKP